jgi:hypothetical protein
MVLGFYAIAIDYAFGYTIVYTIGFPKCYDISYFIWNACNVNDYANGDVIGYAIGYNISYAIGYAISYAIGSAIAIPLAVPLAMPFALPGIVYSIVYSMIFTKSSNDNC